MENKVDHDMTRGVMSDFRGPPVLTHGGRYQSKGWTHGDQDHQTSLIIHESVMNSLPV